jgi:hypothetical protein
MATVQPDTKTSSAGVALPSSTSSLVNFTPLQVGGSYSNVNPAMNTAGAQGNVDVSQASSLLEQFDIGLLEGLPRGMFDWGEFASWLLVFVAPFFGFAIRGRLLILVSLVQWENYFSRFQVPAAILEPQPRRLSDGGVTLPTSSQQQQPQEKQIRTSQRRYT